VKIRRLHAWNVTTSEAKQIQERLRNEVIRQGEKREPLLVAGADISIRQRKLAIAAVVVLKYPEMTMVEAKIMEDAPKFPYVPGLLTFREAPLLLRVFEQLSSQPDLVLFDGQGIAHPRRFGIAAHIGLLLDTPAVGCAKSRLCGEYLEPAQEKASRSDLTDKGELIGAVVRTKARTKPLFISVGHKISLDLAVRRVLDCTRGFRLPEPTRLAHLAAGGNLAVTT
jgi:deoxyribonuclease V